MPLRRYLFVFATCCLAWLWAIAGPEAVGSSQQAPPSTAPSTDVSSNRALIARYCITCHNQRIRTAGLMLDTLDVAHVSAGAEVWEKVVKKLRSGAMPPAGSPRPDQASYDRLSTYLETALDRAAAATPNPGRPAVHRLNRAEYANAIRDLLTIDVDADAFLPPDDSGYGFDNIADVLSVTPRLLERYIAAAGKVSREAVGDAAIRPAVAVYSVPPFLMQDGRMSDDLPFGSRGGLAIRHHFPVDGEYVIKVRLLRGGNFRDGEIIGLSRARQVDFLVEGEKVKQFTVGGKPTGAPGRDPYDTVEDRGDAGLHVTLPVKAGPTLIGVTFPQETVQPEGGLFESRAGERFNPRIEENIIPLIDSVLIEGPQHVTGPGETPSRTRIFVCRPTGTADERPCARKILAALARRAYRRPVTAPDVEALLGLYTVGRDQGDFETGIRMALQGILVAPPFLFRVETDPPKVAAGTAYRISDLELASRLSFFLWSSIPDEPLLAAAANGTLRNPVVLDRHVRRMLVDPRAWALVNNFAGQWLYLRNVTKVVPDSMAFPHFDENVRAAMLQETQLFFDSNLREDQSVLNLLNANYTFLNERLARFYGIPNVRGSHFRRVALDGHEERRGLLGHASILTVTSYANRTAPTLRGKWVLENFLGAPPPPPPPDVPSLKEEDTTFGKPPTSTMRERMEAHRTNPACAACHARMDPLGFALENFNGIGEWRTAEAGTPIDASGALPDGRTFDGPGGLREILLSRGDDFATTITEKLLTYALGRGVEYYDLPVIRQITRQAAPTQYRWSSLILGIVKSTPFQMRISKPTPPETLKTAVANRSNP